MKKIKYLSVLIVILICQGCSTSINLAKRKHRGGYYLDVNNSKLESKISDSKQEAKLQKPIFIQSSRDSKKNEESLLTNNEDNKSKEVIEKDIVVKSKVFSQLKPTEELLMNTEVDSVVSTETDSQIGNSKSEMNTHFGKMLFASISLAGLFLIGFKKIVRSAAVWAAKNKNKARFIIASSTVSLSVISFLSGLISSPSENVGIKAASLSTVAVVAALISVGKSKSSELIKRKKIGEFVMVSSLLGVIHFGGNSIQATDSNSDVFSSVFAEKISSIKKSATAHFVSDLESKQLPVELKVLLTLLTVALVATIISFALIFGCLFYCQGAIIVASLITLGGVVGGLFLGSWLMLLIWRGLKKNDKEPEKRSYRMILYSLLILVIGAVASFFGYMMDF